MNIPRILPLVAVAVIGVAGVKLVSGVENFPDLLKGAQAFAEEAAKPAKDGKDAANAGKASSPLPPNMTALATAKPAAAVCAPTAAELAHEAGLSPGELQVLQSLGSRRGQLDQREQSMDVNMQLLAAAEAKLDAKLQALAGAKADIQALLGQTDAAQAAEVNRLVGVYAAMKPKDAAARMALLTDEVRLPIAAKMKDRNLGQILAQMTPVEAKNITEKLASRYNIKAIADAKAALNPVAATPTTTAAAAPPPTAPKTTPAPKPVQQAAAAPPPAKPKAKPKAQARAKPAKPTAVAANTANTAKPPAATAAATPAKPEPYQAPAPAAAKSTAPAAAPAAKS